MHSLQNGNTSCVLFTSRHLHSKYEHLTLRNAQTVQHRGAPVARSNDPIVLYNWHRLIHPHNGTILMFALISYI